MCCRRRWSGWPLPEEPRWWPPPERTCGATTREAIAGLFSRAGQAQDGVLHRLDTMSEGLAALAGAEPAVLDRAAEEQRRAWQTRFLDLFGDLDRAGAADELAVAAEALRLLAASVERLAADRPETAGGLPAHEVHVRADHGSFAAGVVNGPVTVGPTKPEPAAG